MSSKRSTSARFRGIAVACHRGLSLTLVALLVSSTTARGAALGFDGSDRDDVARIGSIDEIARGAVYDGRGGIDTLLLEGMALSQVLDAGAQIHEFERIHASYASRTRSDALKREGVESFAFRYRADTSASQFSLSVDLLGSQSDVLGRVEIAVQDTGSRRETVTIHASRAGRSGSLIVRGGAVAFDSLEEAPELTQLVESVLHDGGFIAPVPPGDQEPLAVLACLIFGPAAVACAAGALVAIAVFCCSKPDGSPGA